jgi:putative ABC transport system substrate-binding protein
MQFDQLKRRECITLLGGVAAWPLAVRAEQTERIRRISFLSSIAESDPEAQSMVDAFQHALRKLGWIDDRNLQIDRRCAAGNLGRVQTFAKELVGLQPDVIVGYSTPAIFALRKETGTIPIVFVQLSDPIGSGFITNLAKPGGNITGFTNFESSMVGKWVELLKEMAPGILRVAFLFNPATAPYVVRYYQPPLEAAVRSFGMQPSAYPVHSAREIESVITAGTNREALS